MSDVVSKRNLIMAELRKRLAAAFPSSRIDRGFQEESVTTYDHFYLLDMPEALELTGNRRGMYECTMPVSISYWLQTDPADSLEVANVYMERIRLAIETDEYFGKLCLEYGLDEEALVWYDTGVVDIEMMYLFTYTKDAGWVSRPFKQ